MEELKRIIVEIYDIVSVFHCKLVVTLVVLVSSVVVLVDAKVIIVLILRVKEHVAINYFVNP